LKKRVLGTSGLEVSTLGLGCVGMTHHRSTTMDRDAAIALIRKAVDIGVAFFDTAQTYGPFTNEQLVGDAIAPVRDQVVVATSLSRKRCRDDWEDVIGSWDAPVLLEPLRGETDDLGDEAEHCSSRFPIGHQASGSLDPFSWDCLRPRRSPGRRSRASTLLVSPRRSRLRCCCCPARRVPRGPLRSLSALAATLTTAELVGLPDQGHDAIDSAPDLIVTELRRFFDNG
jgi:hypothetical protein